MDWLQRITVSLAQQGGIDAAPLELTDEDRTLILDVARTASHTSGDRRNAPLLCYVLGLAASGGVTLDQAAAIINAFEVSPEV